MKDERLERLDPSLLDRVRVIGRPYDQFIALVDALIGRNPHFTYPDLPASESQRALAVVATLDAQIQNRGLLQFFWNCPQLVEHVGPALRRVGAAALAEEFEKAVEQLAGGIDLFVKRRGHGKVDDFLAEAEEEDFEWFEDAYFGERDRGADRWSGLVEEMYQKAVGLTLGHLGEFVMSPP
jgi:hypothetical protein